MKKFLFLSLLLSILFTAVKGQGDSTAHFKVYGNCESCKARIEKAAKAGGASKAEWNVDSKMMEVSFNPSKTSSDKIQQKIASVGHDTEKFQSLESSYNKLPGCCKYEREEKIH